MGRLAFLLPLVLVAGAAAGHGAVVINEIHYRPKSDLQEDEFLEIHNTGLEAVDLSGWSFTAGVTFTFPAGTSIAGGGYLVVARDAERLRAQRGLGAEVVGSYTGALSNGGETLELSDARGKVVNRVRYSDDFPWPEEPDGGGPSLECVNPLLDNSSPRDWLPSRNGASWVAVDVESAATSNRLYLYLEGAGECLVDGIRITEPGSNVNLFPEGDFEAGAPGWSFAGTHSGSFVSSDDSFSGSRALHLVATGPGSTVETSATRVIDAIVVGRTYRLSFHAKPVSGNSSLINRVTGGGLIARTDLRRVDGTPGRENSVRRDALPPIIYSFEIDPPLPAPGQAARLLAYVEADRLTRAAGIYDDGSGPVEVTLRDDGAGGDDVAGDGLFAGLIPGMPRGAIVDYRAYAVDATGARIETPVRRYPVASFDVASNLPVYNIFIRPADWDRLNADIWTRDYFPAVFVAEGQVFPDAGLRFRGGRTRLFRKKSFRVKLPDATPFHGRDRVLLKAAAMDDDYMTEPLSHWFYERCGVPASKTRFARVELNGEFWGLFIDVEPVDETYLARQGLAPDGALYEAVGIVGSLRKLEGVTWPDGGTYTYESQYEKDAREEEPYDDLIELIHSIHDTPAAQLEAYLEAHVDVPQYLNYLAVSNVMCVWDHIQHNFFLHRDVSGDGKWRVIPWDLDHAWGEWEWVYHYDDTFPVLMGTKARPFAGVWYTWNELWTALLGVPRFRTMYEDRIRELLNTRLLEGPIFERIDAMRAEIEATVLLDEAKWPDSLEPQHTGPRRTMAQEIPFLKQNIALRRKFLAGRLGVKLADSAVPRPFRRGDVDGDGATTLADALDVLWSLFLGSNGLDCADAADADDSGQVDLADALRILGYLFRSEAPPPAPGPATCGVDPTPDGLGCDYSTCD